MDLFPTADEQKDVHWLFRIPQFAIWAAAFIGILQLFIWKVVSPSAFSSGEGAFYGFVSTASIQISILVLTLTPAMAALILAVTTREELGLAFLGESRQAYRGVWQLFSPMLPATATMFVVFLIEPIQAAFESPALSGLLATLLFGLIFLQVMFVLYTAMGVRAQITGAGESTAIDLKRLESEGKIQILKRE